jgi:hypothetical protein
LIIKHSLTGPDPDEEEKDKTDKEDHEQQFRFHFIVFRQNYWRNPDYFSQYLLKLPILNNTTRYRGGSLLYHRNRLGVVKKLIS